MTKKHLSWVIGALLMLSLATCTLAEVTPPVTEAPSTTAVVPTQTASPVPSPTVIATEVVTKPIKSNDIEKLVLTHRAAVSNIQDIVWAQDSASLALITQNTDSDDNQVFGVTVLKSADLTTQSVYTSVGNRIAAVAPDGKTAAVIDKDLKALSFVDTGLSITTLGSLVTDYTIGNVSFSPDLRYIAVTKQESWEVVLYDFTTLEEVRLLSGFETAAPVFDARFDDSSQWIVWHARGTIQLQEVETGRMNGIFSHEDFVSSYALSPDGMILASSAGKIVDNEMVPAIMLWDTSTSAEIQTLTMSGPVNAMQFSPDGKLLAVAIGNDLQLWNAAGGTLLTRLTGHTDTILQVAFSPNQQTIASAGLDNQLLLWQIPE